MRTSELFTNLGSPKSILRAKACFIASTVRCNESTSKGEEEREKPSKIFRIWRGKIRPHQLFTEQKLNLNPKNLILNQTKVLLNLNPKKTVSYETKTPPKKT